MLLAKLGIRNLTRNRWRTVLTLGAIALAVAMMVWMLAFYEGWMTQMVRGATAVETAQVQIHTAAYADKARVYRAFEPTPELLERIQSTPGVIAVAPRIEAHGLLGNEQRSQVVRLLGVDPVRETEVTPVADGLIAGRWLAATSPAYPAPRETVLGEGVARQLRVSIGAELVVFLEAADGSLGNELLEVVGIVRTGNTAVDRLTAYIHLEDAAVITALDQSVHELAIHTTNIADARSTARAIADATNSLLGYPENAAGDEDTRLVVQSWNALLPAIDQMVLLFRRSYWVMYLMVYLVAAIGILNTQRMSVLERRREFGVLIAIGMRPRRLFGALQVEAAVLGFAGAALGATLGGLLAWYHAAAGINLARLTDQASFSYMGVAFSDRLYSVITTQSIVQPILVMLVVALLCGLIPAVQSARLDPVPTLSGRVQ